MKYRSLDGKFICPDCCPDFDYRRTQSQEAFRLVSFDNSSKRGQVQLLEKKINEQLSATNDHEGILKLLDELKVFFVPICSGLYLSNFKIVICEIRMFR
jgi:hypothetical protein